MALPVSLRGQVPSLRLPRLTRWRSQEPNTKLGTLRKGSYLAAAPAVPEGFEPSTSGLTTRCADPDCAMRPDVMLGYATCLGVGTCTAARLVFSDYRQPPNTTRGWYLRYRGSVKGVASER